MKNRLAAIYNCFFDSLELLPYSLSCIANEVDEVIIIYQTVSNFGENVEEYELFSPAIQNLFSNTVFTMVRYNPILNIGPAGGTVNECAKRNLGLKIAKEHACTYFILMDADELYEDFGSVKKQYFDSGCGGSVCRIYTYFKKPIWRFENFDNYFVPFIHELKHDTVAGSSKYPFYVDPTRKVNETDIMVIDEPMHHYSYVRKDIEMKVRNSSATANIQKSGVLADYYHWDLGPGYFVKHFGQKLIEVENIFGIEI